MSKNTNSKKKQIRNIDSDSNDSSSDANFSNDS